MTKAQERLQAASEETGGNCTVIAGDVVAVINPEANRVAAALVRGARNVPEDSKLIISVENLQEALEGVEAGGDEDADVE